MKQPSFNIKGQQNPKDILRLLDEADAHEQQQMQQPAQQSPQEILRLLDEADANDAQQPVSSFGEDIANLPGKAKGLYEGVQDFLQTPINPWIEGITEHPMQALGGVIPAITSTADVIPAAYNALSALPDYITEKVTGKPVPKDVGLIPSRLPTDVGHDFGTNIANTIVGAPETESEKYARSGGEIPATFLTATAPLKTAKEITKGAGKIVGKIPGATTIKNVGNKIGEKAGAVKDWVKEVTPRGPETSAKRNLSQNIGGNAEEAIKVKNLANEEGLNLTPGEASGNPVVLKQEAEAGSSKKGALDIAAHHQKELVAQENSINDLLNKVSPESRIVNEEIRDLGKTVIRNKELALQEKAKPFFDAGNRKVLNNNTFGKIITSEPKVKEVLEDVLKNTNYQKELADFPPTSVKVLDVVHKKMRDEADSLYRAGKKHEGDLVNDARKRLVIELEKVSPDYKKARSIYREDMPEIESIRNSKIGKIANMSDDQLKNLSKELYDPTVTDPKVFAKNRDELYKESPELWNALTRQEMERLLEKGEKTGSNFHKNILADNRMYKKFQLAFKGNPEAHKKLNTFKQIFAHLKDIPSVKTSAAVVGMPKSIGIGELVIDTAKKLGNGAWDKEIITLMNGNKWDKDLLKIDKLPMPEKIKKLEKIFSSMRVSTPKTAMAIERAPKSEKEEKEPKYKTIEILKDYKAPALKGPVMNKLSPEDEAILAKELEDEE